MKKLFLIPLVVVMVTGLILSGCSAPAPAPAPTPAPGPATDKQFDLTYSWFGPPVDAYATKIIGPWLDKIEKETNGRVKTTLHAAGSLGNIMDQYDVVLSGTADMASIEPAFTPGLFPLSQAIGLPLLFKSAEDTGRTYWQLIEKHLMDTEFSKVKVLYCAPTPSFQIMTNTKQIRTMADMKGQKLITTEPSMVPVLQELGAAPVFMPPTEIYTALERGLADGAILSFDAAKSFKSYEVTKYRTYAWLYNARMAVIMNLDTWNSLPPDIQQVIEDASGLEKSIAAGKVMDAEEVITTEQIIKPYDMEKGNPEYYSLPDDERRNWQVRIATPIYKGWIADTRSPGIETEEFFADLIKISRE